MLCSKPCCERFCLRLADVTGGMFSVGAIHNLCRDNVDDDMTRNVEFIVELVKIWDNILLVSNDAFSLMDVRDIISFSVYFVIWMVFLYPLLFILRIKLQTYNTQQTPTSAPLKLRPYGALQIRFIIIILGFF